jgi:hypothetical protein
VCGGREAWTVLRTLRFRVARVLWGGLQQVGWIRIRRDSIKTIVSSATTNPFLSFNTIVQSRLIARFHSVVSMNGTTDNPRDTRRTDDGFFSPDLPLGCDEEPSLGAHLVTYRALYTHHGIYVGNGHVIHYSGLADGLRRGPVECISLERFARGRSIRVRCDSRCFRRCEVVERARSRLGERRYHVLTNNCEHFCAWALRDEGRSAQVERLRATPQTLYNAIRMQYARIDPHQHAFVHVLRDCCNWPSLARFGESATITLIRRVINGCYQRIAEATYRIGIAE